MLTPPSTTLKKKGATGWLLRELPIHQYDAFTTLMFYMGEGIGPNVNRERLLSPWVQSVNYQSSSGSN
jgi:hypothetical protein